LLVAPRLLVVPPGVPRAGLPVLVVQQRLLSIRSIK
jgi:hypothetical protein